MSDEVIVMSANFGGAVRQVPAIGGHSVDRPAALAGFIKDPIGKGNTTDLPVLVGVQEMTRMVCPANPLTDYPAQVTSHLGDGTQQYYVPTVTTEWYPLKEKWEGRWKEGIALMEQGMATFAINEAKIATPWIEKLLDLKGADDQIKEKVIAACPGLVLDLPMIDFLQDDHPNLIVKVPADWADLPLDQLPFRASRYRGNRNTERRVATAHIVWLHNEKWTKTHLQFLFINLHLTTLKAEDNQSQNPLRTARVPTEEATLLRYLQLGVVRDFIWEVYEQLKLPVIVAGDFNANSNEPELKRFMNEANLTNVFSDAQCWADEGQPATNDPKNYYGHSNYKTVLTDSSAAFQAIVPGGTPTEVRVTEYCANKDCGKPLFTHKRNFGLIDNLLYTDSTRQKGLESILEPTDKGIRLNTYFSDHLPIWCKFRIRRE